MKLKKKLEKNLSLWKYSYKWSKIQKAEPKSIDKLNEESIKINKMFLSKMRWRKKWDKMLEKLKRIANSYEEKLERFENFERRCERKLRSYFDKL